MAKYIQTTKEYLEKLIKEDVLLVREENLISVPCDHIDAVLFMFTQGMNKEIHNDLMITLDEPDSSKYFRLLAKKEIMVYVFSDRKVNGKSVIWNMMLTKEKVEGHEDPKKLFIGAESLRTFCDANNIYYKTAKTSEGVLLSGSNLMWLKNESEDCRKIANMEA